MRFTRHAVADLRRLDEFLRERNPAAADRVSRVLEKAFRQLARFPHSGQLLDDHRPFRQMVVPFGVAGYLIRYRLEDDVVVIRITNARERRPTARLSRSAR
ncbi:MAG: type II toxin-antitoxin system RelE/ParE family toxin [Myxococcota bacterium]